MRYIICEQEDGYFQLILHETGELQWYAVPIGFFHDIPFVFYDDPNKTVMENLKSISSFNNFYLWKWFFDKPREFY